MDIIGSKFTPYLGAKCDICLKKCFGGTVDKKNKLHCFKCLFKNLGKGLSKIAKGLKPIDWKKILEEELAQKECDFQKPNCSKKGDLEWFCLPYFKNDAAICKNCEKYLADKLSKMDSEIQRIEYLVKQPPSKFRVEIDMDKIIEEVCQENSLTCVLKEVENGELKITFKENWKKWIKESL